MRQARSPSDVVVQVWPNGRARIHLFLCWLERGLFGNSNSWTGMVLDQSSYGAA